MSRILAEKFYDAAGIEVDEKLKPMQAVIFGLARKKAIKGQRVACACGKIIRKQVAKKKMVP